MSVKSYGVLGCGMMGREHLENLALLSAAKARVVFDPDATMRAKVAGNFPGVRVVSTLAEALEEEGIDAWVLAGPNHTHLDQLLAVEASAPAPILLEKPACIDEAQLAQVEALDSRYPFPIWVAMEYRYMPPIAALIGEIRHGETLGNLVSVSIREHRFPFLRKVNDWNRFNRYTGGTLVEKCCHFFDLMRLMTGTEPVRLFASGGRDVNHLDENYSGETPDVIDNAMVCVDFKGGKRCLLELCMFAEGSEYQEEITVLGDRGKIECFVPGPRRFWPENLGEAPRPKLVFSPRFPKGSYAKEIPISRKLLEAGDHNGATFYQHSKFLDVLNGRQTVEVGLGDGMKAVKMGLSAHRSIETGQAVLFDA